MKDYTRHFLYHILIVQDTCAWNVIPWYCRNRALHIKIKFKRIWKVVRIEIGKIE